jgi:hypothetical protein
MTRHANVLLALTGAAVLLGCQIDPVGKAPGGLEPSPSSQQSKDSDDAGSGAGSGAGRSDGGGSNGDG